ncbi:hypothetical protein PVAND_002401 [Polypedilum vanderplanki]|uniref:Translation machinery-associated protein 16 n=1 Tax=Polypedilum vanderplanki TaxID=319348 RepID=A0A9J6BQV7_POLVA|nr:hypothetical protein PVAND_002401 [Polypedilum vanderplanki]
MGSKKKLLKRIDEINHPGSRKTLATIRDIKRIKKRDEIKKGHALKANVKGAQLIYFLEKIEEKYGNIEKKKLEPHEFHEIIESYFHRFDEELEQIQLKTQVNKRRQNQHSSREAIIKMNLENEIRNYRAGGLELPNLTDEKIYQKFRNWDGNSHNLQHIEMRFISKSFLDKLAQENEETNKMNVE